MAALGVAVTVCGCAGSLPRRSTSRRACALRAAASRAGGADLGHWCDRASSAESGLTHIPGVGPQSRRADVHESGLNLAYAFNHAEAGPRFAKPRASIPNWRWPTGVRRWSWARTSTPRWSRTRNAPGMTPSSKALSPKKTRHATRARLHRCARRALHGQPEDRQRARPRARGCDAQVHEQFPTDIDAAMLYVESVMDLAAVGLLAA